MAVITQAQIDRILGSSQLKPYNKNQSTITNTPRDIVSGTYADILKPFVANPVAEFIGATDMQKALESASYRSPITTGGSVQTGGIRPEYLMAALGLTPIGKGKKTKTAFEKAHDLAQKNAVEMLGLPAGNTAMDRAKALAGLKIPDNYTIDKKGLNNLVKSDVVQRAHEVGDLKFNSIPIEEYNKKSNKLVYSSPSGSEYKLGVVNGEPVYMRKSNHFGEFATNVYTGENAANALKQIGNFGDNGYQSIVSRARNTWDVKGGIKDKFVSENSQILSEAQPKIDELRKKLKSVPASEQYDVLQEIENFKNSLPIQPYGYEAGYIPLSELNGRLPMKKYGGTAEQITEATKDGTFRLNASPYDAQLVKLPNGQYRSRFAAFDPARTHEADLLGMATPEMMGLLAAGSAGGIAYANNNKKKND